MAFTEHYSTTRLLLSIPSRQQLGQSSMLSYRPMQWLLLLAVLTRDSHGCSSPWFGKHCDLECRCQNGCLSSGLCVGNRGCQDGYFDPGCQYVDLFFSHGKNNPPFIADNDITTCNPDNNSRTLTLQLNISFRLYWLILHLSVIDFTFDPTVSLNGLPDTCHQKEVFTDGYTVHIFCSSNNVINSVEIQGRIVAHVCLVKISGGRKIGYVPRGRTPTTTEVAPDDNCSITDKDLVDNEWNLTFADTAVLYSVRIYRRLYYIHQTFILRALSDTGKELVVHTGNSTSSEKYLDVAIHTHEPVATVSIRAGPGLAANEQFLVLCRVETFGDIVCPATTFGIECEHNCSCLDAEFCQMQTGMCSGPCPSGFYGVRCDQACPVNCLDNMCNYRSGACFHCSPGYMGDQCQDECPFNKYGDECASDCGEFCAYEMCDHVSGNCSQCKAGYTGSSCDECPGGKFGTGCSQSCSPYCRNGTCDLDTGNCSLCTDGRIGDMCTDCPTGTFGENCSKTCPENCVGKMCDPDTGICLKCLQGNIGALCQGRVSALGKGSNDLLWFYGSIAGVFLVLSMIFMFLVRDRKSPHARRPVAEYRA